MTQLAARVFIGADHAGYELKQHLIKHLAEIGYEVIDVGAPSYDPSDDYPAYCITTAAAVIEHPGSLGIVIGGSGNGEQIAANKVKGVRAALAWNPEIAQLARSHNDANLVSIGARMHSADDATTIVDAFLSEPFSGDERHIRRINQIATFEGTG